MLENSFFKEFHNVNTFLNNTNTFLLDISLPLINYLLTQNNDFEDSFRQACYNNRRFASKTLNPALLETTDDFLMDMIDAGGCSCHDRNWAEFHQEISESLREYCVFLLRMMGESDFSAHLIVTSSDFGNDYRAIHSDLLDNRIDLAHAEQSVMYWHEAVSDSVMQEAVLHLRYDYLKKLLQLIP